MNPNNVTPPSTTIEGAIAIFAKCPIPGSSKTRLSIVAGDEGCAHLASAMLSDIITCLSSKESKMDNVIKFLVYAPGNEYGEEIMLNLISSLGMDCVSTIRTTMDKTYSEGDVEEMLVYCEEEISFQETSCNKYWHLMPMATPLESKSPNHNIGSNDSQEDKELDEAVKKNLQSSDLGSKLEDVLIRIRNMLSKGKGQIENIDVPIVFLGMDSPEIPYSEMVHAMQIAKSKKHLSISDIDNNTEENSIQYGKAYINPAQDGGYGMLCVPSHAPPSIFKGVRWSTSLTALSQMKALTDNGIDVVVGSLMNDIDQPTDLMNLAVRLCLKYSSSSSKTATPLTPMSMKHSSQFDRFNVKKEIHIDRLSHPSEIIDQEKEDGGEDSEQILEMKTRCFHTFNTLIGLDLVQIKERTTSVRYMVSLNKFQVEEL